jgi:hypothetical protein
MESNMRLKINFKNRAIEIADACKIEFNRVNGYEINIHGQPMGNLPVAYEISICSNSRLLEILNSCEEGELLEIKFYDLNLLWLGENSIKLYFLCLNGILVNNSMSWNLKLLYYKNI